MNHKEQLAAAIKRAEALAEAASVRDLTATESAEIKSLTEQISDLTAKVKAKNEADALVERLGASGRKLAALEPDYGYGGPPIATVPGAASGFLRLAAKAGATAVHAVARMPLDGAGRKAIGDVVLPVAVDMDVVTLDKPAGTLFDVMPAIIRSSPKYVYFRQTTRTNNAAVVARGALKPTSIYDIEKIENELAIVAHLAGPFGEYDLLDSVALQQIVEAELRYGLVPAIEAKIVADILADEDIKDQVFATDAFATVRRAIAQLEAQGAAPGFRLMNPDDWASAELAVDAAGRYLAGGGAPISTVTRRLWNVPVVASTALDAGRAILVGAGAATLSTDGVVNLRWAATGTDFEKNQQRARCEGRFAVDVTRPWAIVDVALTDESA